MDTDSKIEALCEKVKRLTDLADTIGQSRSGNAYAQNTSAVVKFCALEDEVARDIKALVNEAEQEPVGNLHKN